MTTFLQKIYWEINKKYYHLQKELHELKSISIEITGVCNLQCKHCYMRANNSNANDLTTEEWKTFFKQVRTDFGNKISIGITGGEPLIRADLLDLLNYLKQLGLTISLTTNGTLLNEKNLPEIKKCVSALSISLDGLETSHNYLRQIDNFHEIIKKIKLCKKFEIPYLVVKTTVHKRNIAELDNLYELIKNLEIDKWHLFAMEAWGKGEINSQEILSATEYENLCEFIDKIKNDRKNKVKIVFGEESSNFMYDKTCHYNKFKLCNAGISSCAIFHNGNIVSCIQSNRDNLKAVQGNIKYDNLKKIWETKFIRNRDKNYQSCNSHYF